MSKTIAYTIAVIILFAFTTLVSVSFRVGQIPNGGVNSCQNCHLNPAGGGNRNAFGKLVESRFLISGNVNWSPLMASLDADNDGVSNGEELQDPFGLWSGGSTNPGNNSIVSNPGLQSSNNLSMLNIAFNGMAPHAGQKLSLRVIDKFNMGEVGRTTVSSITDNFTVSLNVVLPGHSYYIDFYADHNGNGFYDAPPVDHAWRIELNNAAGNDQINFSHNTDFTDINWQYLLTVQFAGMTPHIGQLFELKVEDDLTGAEIGRKRIEMIDSDTFTITIPGIVPGREYKVEFYADLNKNGLYDEPSADHAWELKFTNSSGDFSLPFTHNTDFKNINWKYLYTLNFSGMTPHISQFFELSIVRNDNGEEIGRTSINISGEAYTVSIPGIEIGHDYRVDFYADHNGSGQYEAPPADHSWRLSFNSPTGNFVQNFSHNTNFTDIEWPNITGIENEISILNPKEFQLAQNYPNPFNPTTNIRFSLPVSGFVELKVFDLLGREVAVLVSGNLSYGVHKVTFDASGLNSGIYLYRLRTENYVETKKMIFVK